MAYAAGGMARRPRACTVGPVDTRAAARPWGRSDWSDLALAAALLALSASVLAGFRSLSPAAVAWVLVVAHCLPVAVRRRAPRAAFAASFAAGAAYLAFRWPMVGLGLAALVMTYSLAAFASRRDSLAGLAAVAAALVAAALVGARHPQLDTLLGNLVVTSAAWVLGDSTRRRREEAEARQHRLARQAVTEERLRIARELHDVVAHSMTVIAVQAGTGRMVIDDDVDHARRALRSIEDTSKRALEEMRRLLGVLRADSPEAAALAPVPTLDDLDRLVAHAVEGGTPVDLRVDGDPRPVPAGVELAAYRILQEALTNVRRHAPGAPAHVRLGYADDALVVEVENRLADGGTAGGAAGAAAAGHGLLGMRERVSVYGGAFEAGPGPGGTFRVRASLPLDPAAR